MKKLIISSKQFQAFALAVEMRLFGASISGKGEVTCPKVRRAETAGQVVRLTADAFLRWLQIEQSEGRHLDPSLPRRPGGRFDGHWSGLADATKAKTRAARRGSVNVG